MVMKPGMQKNQSKHSNERVVWTAWTLQQTRQLDWCQWSRRTRRRRNWEKQRTSDGKFEHQPIINQNQPESNPINHKNQNGFDGASQHTSRRRSSYALQMLTKKKKQLSHGPPIATADLDGLTKLEAHGLPLAQWP